MTTPGMSFQGRIWTQDYEEAESTPTVPGWEEDSTPDNSNPVYWEEVQSESIVKTQRTQNFRGMDGEIVEDIAREKDGVYDVGGQIELATVSAHSLDIWLPRILHKRPAATVFTGGTAKIEFGALIDRGITKTGGSSLFEYLGLQVQRAVISGREGEPLRMVCDLLGKSASASLGSGLSAPATAGTNYTGVPTGVDGDPYWMFHATLSAFGGTKVFHEFQLTIENIFHVRRNNSQGVDEIHIAGRNMTFSVGADWAVDYADNVHEGTAAAGTLTFTNGAVSCATVMGALQQREENDPVLSGVPNAIEYPLNLAVLANGATEAIEITNDSTP